MSIQLDNWDIFNYNLNIDIERNKMEEQILSLFKQRKNFKVYFSETKGLIESEINLTQQVIKKQCDFYNEINKYFVKE
jgi:hypothetical protein